jgi:hypothetical protein
MEVEMSGIQRVSAHVIDYAERLSDMADAAEGKHHKTIGKFTRWSALPAAGAALYAFVRSDYFSKQAKGVMSGAKVRAEELPNDLMARVHEATNGPARRNGSRSRGSTTRSRRRTSARKTNRSRATSSGAR